MRMNLKGVLLVLICAVVSGCHSVTVMSNSGEEMAGEEMAPGDMLVTPQVYSFGALNEGEQRTLEVVLLNTASRVVRHNSLNISILKT